MADLHRPVEHALTAAEHREREAKRGRLVTDSPLGWHTARKRAIDVELSVLVTPNKRLHTNGPGRNPPMTDTNQPLALARLEPGDAHDELYELHEDGHADEIVYLRDDIGTWWAMGRVEAYGGHETLWFSVAPEFAEQLAAQHAFITEAVGGRR